MIAFILSLSHSKLKKKNDIQWPEKLYIDDVTSHHQCPGIKLIMMMMMIMWMPT